MSIKLSSKPKLKLLVQGAIHFARWEMSAFNRYFELVNKADDDVILFAFGPDVFYSAAQMPALRRIALLFPGFGFNPYHELDVRQRAAAVIDANYDLVFVNPGAMYEIFHENSKIAVCPFSLDIRLVRFKRPRTALNSLLHVSANYPQKDWRRSEAIMKLTGLNYEVFPPRNNPATINVNPRTAKSSSIVSSTTHLINRIMLKSIATVKNPLNRVAMSVGQPQVFMPSGYKHHQAAIAKYQQYDGFVHVAAETPPLVDGKYTASLLEAGLTGAILFWHDTLGLGNDFETVFDLSLEPAVAAATIMEIRSGLNVEKHSRLTREEVLDRCSPEKIVRERYERILQLL